MIRLIEALNFRSLKYIKCPLESFHVLVGPNASGKTTFLDVVSFLGHLVSESLDFAIKQRTENFHDLTWRRTGSQLELALEAKIPKEIRQRFPHHGVDIVRYEVSVGLDPKSDSPSILRERVLLKKENPKGTSQVEIFPLEKESPKTIALPNKRGVRTTVSRDSRGKVNFYTEKSGKGWINSFQLGARKSALGNLPEDETKYPVSTWLKQLLSQNVQSFVLNSLLIRRASPSAQKRSFNPDGSNLPWVIHRLSEQAPQRFQAWISHLQTALPDIESIRTIENEDDKTRYLVIRYRNQLEVPSWLVSDGTLRLLALTIPAYLPDFEGIYLIEEPENGIHPRAVQTLFQSLSSVYKAQILLATHSPIVLGIAEVQSILCFAKTESGSTDIVRGSEHPRLINWRQETSLGELFAAGVLDYAL
jgi:predicted ATPase